MKRVLGLLGLSGCFVVSELSPEEPCRQARLAAVDRVWTCSGDSDRAVAVLDTFDRVYACQINGWGSTFLDSGVELGRAVLVGEEPTVLTLPAALGCGVTLRQVDCELALLPLEEGWVRAADPVCAVILDGPGLDLPGDSGTPYRAADAR